MTYSIPTLHVSKSDLKPSLSMYCLDQKVVLKKCPQLVQEMVSILSQLWVMHRSRGGKSLQLRRAFSLMGWGLGGVWSEGAGRGVV